MSGLTLGQASAIAYLVCACYFAMGCLVFMVAAILAVITAFRNI